MTTGNGIIRFRPVRFALAGADIKVRAQGKITDIEERIRILGRMKRALERLAAECSGNGPVTECPILGALDPDEETQHVER